MSTPMPQRFCQIRIDLINPLLQPLCTDNKNRTLQSCVSLSTNGSVAIVSPLGVKQRFKIRLVTYAVGEASAFVDRLDAGAILVMAFETNGTNIP